MITKTFLLELNNTTARAIQTIALAIPCFISLFENKNYVGYGEYTIQAREADWGFVERILAPIV